MKPEFSDELKTLLTGLLEKNPHKRLTVQEVKQSKWWKFTWDDIVNNQIRPPFVPKLQNKFDIVYFDDEFTNQQVESYDDQVAENFSNFEKFDYKM